MKTAIIVPAVKSWYGADLCEFAERLTRLLEHDSVRGGMGTEVIHDYYVPDNADIVLILDVGNNIDWNRLSKSIHQEQAVGVIIGLDDGGRFLYDNRHSVLGKIAKRTLNIIESDIDIYIYKNFTSRNLCIMAGD